MSEDGVTRREGLGLAALILAAGAPATAQAAAPRFATKIDFKDPVWNRDTYARLEADLDPAKQKIGWFNGRIYGVRENEPVRTLLGFDGFGIARVLPLPDGSYRKVLREVVFYRDVKTGEILKTWRNPYTGEDVNVVPVANDPFNFTISEYFPEPPSYGGLNQEKQARRPLLLDWERRGKEDLQLRTEIHLYYPASLQRAQWPRESAGPYNRVSEMFTYNMKVRDVENPRVTHIPYHGLWSRVTPWLPWMLMGQAPGCINYFADVGTADSISDLPADTVAAARAIGDKYLSAPTTDYGPSLSSLENYKLTQKPAPVPPGWKPPMPPAQPAAPPPRPT